jgi:dTDP-4-dehydrorhamnose 3,5-epimerase
MTVDAEEPHMIWAPASFARGWCALSDIAEIEYLCTGVYNQRSEAAIRWNDPEIGIAWPTATPILSPKDREAPSLQDWLQRPESLEFSFEAVA